MQKMNEQEYRKKYDEVVNYTNSINEKFKAKEISYENTINLIKQKVKELGFKKPLGLMPEHPDNVFNTKEIVLKEGECTDPWTSPYYVPEGNWLYDKPNDCGIGCLCVDNGADRPSLDKINSLKFIELGQVCDGSKEHKPRPRTKPMLAFDYKSKKPMNLNNLKLACRTSERISIDDLKSPRIIDNLCTGEELTEESTKQVRKGRKYPQVGFFGKTENTREFWEDAAYAIQGLEGDFYQSPSLKPQKSIKNTQKTKPKRNSFNFGEGFPL